MSEAQNGGQYANESLQTARSAARCGLHKERHKQHGDVIRDLIIGFSDGLTVPFALTAGLSSLGSTHLVVLGGLAELFAGSISMGLGAWLAAVTDKQHYQSEEARERREVAEKPLDEEEEIYDILAQYSVSRDSARPLVQELKRDEDMWVQFMMDFELRLEKPASSRSWVSALTMGLAYFGGGLLPMIPYFAMHDATHALFVSIGITVTMLIIFGYVKCRATVTSQKACLFGAVQTLAVGVIAAGVSYGIVKALNSRMNMT